MPSIKCFLDMLLVSFWFSSMSANTLLYPCSLATAKAFVACNGNLSLCGVNPVTTGLVSTQTTLISHNRHSVKLPFFFGKPRQSTWLLTSCILKFVRNWGGPMHEMNWIFEQMPPPHFCLKLVWKWGGGGIFSEAWSIYSVVVKCLQKSAEFFECIKLAPFRQQRITSNEFSSH